MNLNELAVEYAEGWARNEKIKALRVVNSYVREQTGWGLSALAMVNVFLGIARQRRAVYEQVHIANGIRVNMHYGKEVILHAAPAQFGVHGFFGLNAAVACTEVVDRIGSEHQVWAPIHGRIQIGERRILDGFLFTKTGEVKIDSPMTKRWIVGGHTVWSLNVKPTSTEMIGNFGEVIDLGVQIPWVLRETAIKYIGQALPAGTDRVPSILDVNAFYESLGLYNSSEAKDDSKWVDPAAPIAPCDYSALIFQGMMHL